MKINEMLKSSINAQKKAIAESRAPKIGPYYWVPKANGDWDLEPWYESDYNSDIMHLNIWPEVLEYLAHEFKVPKMKLRNLAMAYTALPRGRVGVTADGVYTILHGDNAPVSDAIGKVINAFNLRELNRVGKVRAVVDHHEKITPDDLVDFNRALGTKFELKAEDPWGY